jgi:hypothetical protein
MAPLDDLYHDVPVRIAPKALGKLTCRAARFWKPSGTPGKAWVIVWPRCRTSKPVVLLAPVRALRISDDPAEPPDLPAWAHERNNHTGVLCAV